MTTEHFHEEENNSGMAVEGMAEQKDRVYLSEIKDDLVGFRFHSNYVIDRICKVHHSLLPQPLQAHV